MSEILNNDEDRNTSFEEALNKTGFGVYNLSMTVLSGVVIISFACIFFSTTIVVPISACELNTTGTQQGILVAGPIVGSIIGAMFWGHLSDQRGRKNTLIVSLVLGAVINALGSISINWIMLLLLQFIASLMISGQYSLAMTILSESVPLAKRNLVMLLVTSIFLLSHGIIAVLAMPIVPLSFSYHVPYLDITWNSWRMLLVVYSVPSLISAIWLSFMQESPKFVYTKGDEKQALKILKAIHRINCRTSPDEYTVKELARECTGSSETVAAGRHITSLFKPPLLKKTVIMTILHILLQVAAFKVWLPTIAQHFMKVVYSDVGSNLTLCQVIASSLGDQNSEYSSHGTATCTLNFSALLIVLATTVGISLANTLITLVVNLVGRRNMVMVVTFVSGTSGVLVNLVPNAVASGVLFLVLLTGIIALGLYTALSVALFPTYIRGLALTFVMSGSRIANFLSVQLINYLLLHNCEVAFYVYGSLLAFSGFVALFLPNDSPRCQIHHERLQEEPT